MIRVVIHDQEIFDREGLADALGLTMRCLSREIALGRLRCCRRSRRQFFLGRDVLYWMQGGAYRPTSFDEEDDVD